MHESPKREWRELKGEEYPYGGIERVRANEGTLQNREDEKVSKNRRRFLAAIVAVGGAAALSSLTRYIGEEPDGKKDSDRLDVSERERKEQEGIPSSERFYDRVAVDAEKISLQFDEARFSSDGKLIGERIPIQDVLIDDPSNPKRKKRISAGKQDENGLFYEGIAGGWINYQMKKLCKKFGLNLDNPKSRPNLLHNTSAMRVAIRNEDEPELIQGIRSGMIRSKLDIVKYFGGKETRNGDGLSRIEYVREKIVFEDYVPEDIQNILRPLIPGLCAKESNFNDDLASKAGAKGIFQFMPETWRHLGYKQEKYVPLTLQVEAAGKYFSEIYAVVTKQSEDALNGIRETFFPNGGFEKYFLVPCIINAYNVGPTGMSRVIDWFWEVHGLNQNTTKEIKKDRNGAGYDLFLKMSDLARDENRYSRHLSNYRTQANGYVPGVLAYAQLFDSEKVRLAQN